MNRTGIFIAPAALPAGKSLVSIGITAGREVTAIVNDAAFAISPGCSSDAAAGDCSRSLCLAAMC